MKNIVLVGFMTSGKSSVGKILASKLSFDFVDLDDWIEVETRMSIPKYFSKYGEEAFRIREKDVLLKSLNLQKYVIATGGGTPCHFDNITTINEQSTSIYLKVEPEKIIGRLKQQKLNRPLVAKLSDAELTEFVHLKLTERAIFYNQATHTIELKNESKAQIASRIMELL